MTFSKKTGNPATDFVAVLSAAPKADTWEVEVVSAAGGCEAFMISKASLPVAKC